MCVTVVHFVSFCVLILYIWGGSFSVRSCCVLFPKLVWLGVLFALTTRVTSMPAEQQRATHEHPASGRPRYRLVAAPAHRTTHPAQK